MVWITKGVSACSELGGRLAPPVLGEMVLFPWVRTWKMGNAKQMGQHLRG